MPALYLIIILFFVSPAVFGYVARSIEKNGLLTDTGKFDERLKTKEVALSIATLISLYIFFALTGYKHLSNSTPIEIIIPTISAIILFSVSLSIVVFKALWIYKRFSLAINASLTIATLWITWYSGSIAIGFVSETTNLSASEMPSAVTGLTLLYTIVLWGLLISFACLFLYTIAGVFFVASSAKKNDKVEKKIKLLTYTALFTGLAITSIISLDIVGNLSRAHWFKDIEMVILTTSGYPLTSHKCFKKNSPEDRFVILSSGKIGVASYKEGKYEFSEAECQSTPQLR